MSETSQPAFRKSLNLVDSSAIVIGSMIGSGIFIVSADMSRTLGSPGWLLVAWLITGFMTIMGALSFGELACMMPKAGGTYVYLREAYSPLLGFLYGWTFFLVIQTGTIAAVAMAFGKFFGVIFPWISESNILFRAGPVKFSSVHLIALGFHCAYHMDKLARDQDRKTGSEHLHFYKSNYPHSVTACRISDRRFRRL